MKEVITSIVYFPSMLFTALASTTIALYKKTFYDYSDLTEEEKDGNFDFTYTPSTIEVTLNAILFYWGIYLIAKWVVC